MDTALEITPEATRALGFAKRAHNPRSRVMHVEFVKRDGGPHNLICEAELHFGTVGPLAGLRLVGFSLWRGTEGEAYVTFPSRAFGKGDERRYFDYLRGEREAVQRFKTYVLDAFKRSGGAAAVALNASADTGGSAAPGVH
jgi:hypothetical protein